MQVGLAERPGDDQVDGEVLRAGAQLLEEIGVAGAGLPQGHDPGPGPSLRHGPEHLCVALAGVDEAEHTDGRAVCPPRDRSWWREWLDGQRDEDSPWPRAGQLVPGAHDDGVRQRPDEPVAGEATAVACRVGVLAGHVVQRHHERGLQPDRPGADRLADLRDATGQQAVAELQVHDIGRTDRTQLAQDDRARTGSGL